MGLRVVQVCGLWFWVAFTFFVLVVINRNRGFLPDTVGRQQLQQLQEQLHQKPKTIGLTSKQRMARSEAAWRSSVVLRHSMAEQHPLHPKIPFFPAQNNDQFGATPYTVWDFFPATYACPHDIQRVGRLGDGGKWVCGMSLYEARPAAAISQNTDTPETIIYSFGVNDESTFEAEMLARIPSAKIFAYDYSVDTFGPQLSPNFKDRAYFSKVGLGDKDELKEPNVQFHTLSTLMAINNHNYIDILKVDVEGSEYTALDAFMDSCDAMGNMPVGQIMIELHLVDDEHVDFERFMSWWERLEGFGLRPTWLEINLLAVTIGKGKTDPRCVEYVWVNHNDEKSILLMD